MNEKNTTPSMPATSFFDIGPISDYRPQNMAGDVLPARTSGTKRQREAENDDVLSFGTAVNAGSHKKARLHQDLPNHSEQVKREGERKEGCTARQTRDMVIAWMAGEA